nr:hypothetical protein [Pseudomonas ogarae]
MPLDVQEAHCPGAAECCTFPHIHTTGHCSSVRHASTWLDNHVICNISLVVKLTENSDLSVDKAGVDQFGFWLDHAPASEAPGVLPFAFRDVQGQEIASFSQFGVSGVVQSQHVGSATSINHSAERTICADVDQVVGLGQLHAGFARFVDIVMFGIWSLCERFETLLQLGSRGDIGRLLSHRNIHAAKGQGDCQSKMLGQV